MLKIILNILIVFINHKLATPTKSKLECGYKQCPVTKDGALNVHIIPHSHMDAGWVKTFDEYYYGTRTSISTANVQLIFHSVLSELLHDKRRKFTLSETAYFWRWWKEQRPGTRGTFRQLVQEGRIEFAGGGWVQNDEATLDYLQIIDLFTWGLRKINDTLGPCGKPKAAWQIDTYGHTREQTSLLAQMGYDGLFIGRVDHGERDAMLAEDRMEFMWRGSDVLGKMSDIMTHTMFNLYNAPEGFCFDFLCSDEPIVDDVENKAYNADKRVNDFIAQIERQAKYYDHDNIMVTMGGDFTYQSAANWFMNMDKLINHINTHPANISDVNVFYSTPSCYLKAIYLYGRRDKGIYTEQSDHLPYSSDPHTYWTGYYSSRPSLKYFVRRAHVFLQVVKQLSVIAKMGDFFELHLLRHAVSLVLHHDAVTGTSQQHVTNDFIRVLTEAVDSTTRKLSNILTYLTPTWGGSRRPKNNQQFVVCHQMNISQCRFTETEESILLLVYNPLSIKVYHHIRLPAIALHYSIRDYNDEEVEYQLVPLPAAAINLPGRSSNAIQELRFEAENIPPLGYAAYYISPVRAQLEENEYARRAAQANKNPGAGIEGDSNENVPYIANEYVKVTVNKDTGLLESIQHVDGVKIEISQNFYYYSQTQQVQQSGAYSFRPEYNRPISVTEKVTYHAVRGTIVKEIRQRFTDWISQTIRLYRGEEFVELEWIVGPVPIGTDLGKEVVTMFTTNITNNGIFYTDSNSRQMMKRTCWNESTTQQQKKPIAACYYPVTSRICIQSHNTSVSVCALTDRAQGGTSYNEGEIELMIHRRLLTDDGFGLEETLNEEAYGVGLVVKGRHRLVFGNFRQEVEEQTFSERVATSARRWHMEPWLFFTSGDKINRKKWQNVRNKRFSAIRIHGLPRFVHVLTLEPWKAGSVLLRLENTLEKPVRGRFRNEKSEGYINKQSHITVHLRALFTHLKIKKVRETTLAANQWLEDARQMDWSTRYVYNGADDDILPEDLEYDEKSTKEKTDRNDDYGRDSGYTSDEDAETEYSKRKLAQKKLRLIGKERVKPSFRSIQSREKRYYDDRKKRSTDNQCLRQKRDLNISANTSENCINGTFLDTEFKTQNLGAEVIQTDKPETNEAKSPKNEVMETTTLALSDNITLPGLNVSYSTKAHTYATFNARRIAVVTKKPAKYTFRSEKDKVSFEPTKFFPDLGNNSEEIHSSEEDISLKKRSPRRRKNGKRKSADPAISPDEDVTKSMYEMYYKSKPKTRLKLIRTSEEDDPKHGRKKKANRRQQPVEEEFDRSTERKYEADFNERMSHSEERRFIEIKRRRRNKKKGRRKKRVQPGMPFFVNAHRNYNVKNNEDASVENTGEATEDRSRKQTSKIKRSQRQKKNYKEKYGERDSRVRFRNKEMIRQRENYKQQEREIESERDYYEAGDMEYEDLEKRRRKRSPDDQIAHGHDHGPPDENQSQVEPDYVITLRPTQIRTFIIWFENLRGPQ